MKEHISRSKDSEDKYSINYTLAGVSYRVDIKGERRWHEANRPYGFVVISKWCRCPL